MTSSPYLEGGALYALGLIHANQGNKEVLEYLRNALRNTQNSVLQHGATLGIGLAALATAEDSIYAQMREVMFNVKAPPTAPHYRVNPVAATHHAHTLRRMPTLVRAPVWLLACCWLEQAPTGRAR